MIAVPNQILSQMANLFGTTEKQLKYLGGGKEFSDGIVYSFLKNNKAYVLKILSVPAKERSTAFKAIEERLKFVHFAGEQGVNIVYPLENERGEFMERVEYGDNIFIGYIMNKLEEQLDFHNAYSPEFNRNFGRTIGQMHKAAKLYPKWKGAGPEGDCDALGWKIEVDFFINWCQDEEVKEAWKRMKATLEQMPYDRESFGFIHNDIHVGNVMKEGSKLFLIDFDVANFHWFINDLVVAAQGLFHKSGGFDRPLEKPELLKTFYHQLLEGYEQENHLGDFWLKHMDTFINYRRMILFTAMQDMMNNRPEIKASYKKMIRENPRIADLVF